VKNPDLIDYKLRGSAGDPKDNEPLELGEEVVIVGRYVVSRTAEHTNADSLVAREVYLQSTAAYVVDGELPAAIRKLLDASAVDKVTGADKLPV
jgi:hypothetical protein